MNFQRSLKGLVTLQLRERYTASSSRLLEEFGITKRHQSVSSLGILRDSLSIFFKQSACGAFTAMPKDEGDRLHTGKVLIFRVFAFMWRRL